MNPNRAVVRPPTHGRERRNERLGWCLTRGSYWEVEVGRNGTTRPVGQPRPLELKLASSALPCDP